jgi:hypothetical protein
MRRPPLSRSFGTTICCGSGANRERDAKLEELEAASVSVDEDDEAGTQEDAATIRRQAEMLTTIKAQRDAHLVALAKCVPALERAISLYLLEGYDDTDVLAALEAARNACGGGGS